ncbi:hypothetical protein GCM10018952_07620 [Streptosporangium vulgare]
MAALSARRPREARHSREHPSAHAVRQAVARYAGTVRLPGMLRGSEAFPGSRNLGETGEAPSVEAVTFTEERRSQGTQEPEKTGPENTETRERRSQGTQNPSMRKPGHAETRARSERRNHPRRTKARPGRPQESQADRMKVEQI